MQNSEEPIILPAQLKSDLKALVALTDEEIKNICAQLRAVQGVLSERRVFELMTEMTSEDAASSLSRIACTINSEVLPRVNEALMRDESPPEFVTAVQVRLNQFIAGTPAFHLMHKAQRLVRETGNESEGVHFYCDVRPIFEENSDSGGIEGFVPIVNVKWQFVRQNGRRETFEAVLTEIELYDLVERASEALRRLAVLQDSIES